MFEGLMSIDLGAELRCLGTKAFVAKEEAKDRLFYGAKTTVSESSDKDTDTISIKAKKREIKDSFDELRDMVLDLIDDEVNKDVIDTLSASIKDATHNLYDYVKNNTPSDPILSEIKEIGLEREKENQVQVQVAKEVLFGSESTGMDFSALQEPVSPEENIEPAIKPAPALKAVTESDVDAALKKASKSKTKK